MFSFQLSSASSYDERSAIRQIIRKRKKERGQNVSKGDSKGRSSYNRFAGSTATKSSAHGNRFVSCLQLRHVSDVLD